MIPQDHAAGNQALDREQMVRTPKNEQTASQDAPPSAPVAAVMAWMLPGLGHWWIGQRGRAVVFFVVITVTFWGGVAVGGVRTTVTPRDNGAWIAAQLCMGPQALGALYWSNKRIVENKDDIKASWPASNIAVVYAGVAGLLNLLVIIDVLARVESLSTVTQSRAPPKPKGKP